MAFIAKTDYFGLQGKVTNLICVSNADGKTASVAEAQDAEGTIVANTVYGETSAPTNSYVLSGDISLEDGDVVLGGVNSDCVLGSFQINTSVANPPTIEASGEKCEANATKGCSYTVPAQSISKLHHAQILFGAFTLNGDGCHLSQANYTASATITKATKDGDCVAHDVSAGKIEASVTIIQSGSNTPTLTAGTGWVVTSPLTITNPDADYPSWTATLTKYLAKDND